MRANAAAKAHSGAGIRFPRERDFRQTSSRRRAASISDENDRFDFTGIP
jgi:hypothetical protein